MGCGDINVSTIQEQGYDKHRSLHRPIDALYEEQGSRQAQQGGDFTGLVPIPAALLSQPRFISVVGTRQLVPDLAMTLLVKHFGKTYYWLYQLSYTLLHNFNPSLGEFLGTISQLLILATSELSFASLKNALENCSSLPMYHVCTTTVQLFNQNTFRIGKLGRIQEGLKFYNPTCF